MEGIMKFEIIDMDKWVRKEILEHFTKTAGCSYSITVNIDITKPYRYIKDNKLRLYPMFTWITSKYINSKKEFRTGYNEQGRLGVNDPEKYLK